MSRFHIFQIATVLALWGVVISAVYMLRAYRTAFWGTIAERCKNLADLQPKLRLPVALLVSAMLWIGFYPQSFVRLVTPAFQDYFATEK